MIMSSIEEVQDRVSELVWLLKKEGLDQKTREQYVTELFRTAWKTSGQVQANHQNH